jgi:hypothetical protein
MGLLLVRGLGSYGLCCLCLLTMFVLTIFGTLHQKDFGLYDAKEKYFNSWFLWYEAAGTSFPIFPGGVLAMSVLTANLITGGLLRIRWELRNAGVVIIHFGIIFLLLAGLVKMTRSEEGHLTLWEQDRLGTPEVENQSDHFKSYLLWEVAIWEVTQGDAGTEYIIPDEHFTDLAGDARRTFTNPALPFELSLTGFVENCDVLPKGPRWQATGDVIDGYGIRELPPEKESERNIAGLHAEIASAGGEPERAILHGVQRSPWVIERDGRTFAIDMRHTRYPMPFQIRLEKFIKEDHPGISMAKAYQSEVTRVDGGGGERVLIQMNEPLREGGLVLFQSSWGPQGGNPRGPFFSVFSVVRDPSDKWPEYAMWVITLGLLIAFGRRLLRFVRKQTADRNRLALDES